MNDNRLLSWQKQLKEVAGTWYKKNTRHKVFALIGLFTLLQFLILVCFGYTPYPDSNGYILLAKDAISQHDWYPVSKELKELAFIWNIGAINSVELSLRLFHSLIPLHVLYTFMKGASALLLWLIARRLFSDKIAFTALLLYIIYPANYGESTSFHSELPFTFFTLLAVYFSVYKRPFLSGISIAIANWYRPMGLVILLALLIYDIVGKQEVRKNFLFKLCGFFILVVLIGGSNEIRTGRFFYQAKTGWMSIMQYSWNEDRDHSQDYSYFPQGDPNIISHADRYDCIQKDSVWESHFFLWLKHNPKEYVCQMPAKLVKTYISDNTAFCTYLDNKSHTKYMYAPFSMGTLKTDFPHYSMLQMVAIVNLLYYYMLCFLFLYTCIHIRKGNYQALTIPVSIIMIGTLLLLFFGHGESRFHIPFMPFIIMMAAVGISRLYKGVKKELQ